MPWSAPTTPVTGTVITVAWASASVVTPINWLRALTGGADPPAANYVVTSDSTTAATWKLIPTASIADAAITDVKLASQKVAQLNPIYTAFDGVVVPSSGFFDITGATGAPTATDTWLLIQNRHWNWTTDYRFQLAVNYNDQNQLYARMIRAGAGDPWVKMWHAGNDGAGSGLDADTLDGTQLSAINQVPSGMIAAFATAAAIPAGWSRYTAADGRLLVGAGTTFSVTFTENTDVGTSWAHEHADGTLSAVGTGGSGSVASGGGSTADPANHGHDVSGSTASTTWTPVARVVVWAQKS